MEHAFVVALLWLGGVLYGALLMWGEDDVDAPMTRDERRSSWWFVWTWPLSLPLSMIDPDRRD